MSQGEASRCKSGGHTTSRISLTILVGKGRAHARTTSRPMPRRPGAQPALHAAGASLILAEMFSPSPAVARPAPQPTFLPAGDILLPLFLPREETRHKLYIAAPRRKTDKKRREQGEWRQGSNSAHCAD